MDTQPSAGPRNSAGERQGSRQSIPNRVSLVPLVCLVLLATAMGCRSAPPWEEARTPAPDLVASMDAPSRLTTGEPVWVRFTLTNTSNTMLYVLTWYTPLEGIAGEIFWVGRDGQPVPYEGILATRIAPSIDDYVALEPGAAASAEVDLATVYDFSQAGAYTVRFISPRISHLATSQAGMASSLDDLGPVQIASNEVTVEIVDPTDQSERRTPQPRTPEKAEGMVRDYLRGRKPALNPEFPLGLEAVPVPEAWDRLSAQVFRVTYGPFARETFLIMGETGLQLGTATGGQGVTSIVVSDLDRDRIAELLFSYSFGSGIHQSRIGMVAPAYGSDRTFEAGIAYRGDVGLSRGGTSAVSVKIVELNDETLTLRYLPTVGYINIERHAGRVDLVLEVAHDLPDDLRKNLMQPDAGSQ